MHKYSNAAAAAIAIVLLFGAWLTTEASVIQNVGGSYSLLTPEEEADADEVNARDR